MLVIAHRGNNKEVLENSISAYERAVECGASRIELDVQLTKDGHAVINHDDGLYHTTGNHLKCSQLNRADFSKIKLKNGESIPFLDEVVEMFLNKIELNIEIKGNEIYSSIATKKIIEKNSNIDKIIISCFHPEPLKYFRDFLPNVKRACLVGDGETHWPYVGHKSPLIFMNEVNATILHPRYDQVSENLMDQAKARNWQVFTWATMIGEDHQAESIWTYLESFGVDGHCTNYPREMIRWQKENEDYEKKLRSIIK